MGGTIGTPKSANHNEFASSLFSVIVDKKASQNVVYSPASIHACLALAFGGAKGQTAKEMRTVLKFDRGTKKQLLRNYRKFLKNSLVSSQGSDDAPQLKMVNRLYVNNQLKIAAKFNKIAENYFDAKAESLDFSKNQEMVENINHWIEEQTENKIKNLLQSDALNYETSAILVNAIYFKAKWLQPFSNQYTSKAPFHVNNEQQTEIDMMYIRDRFGYAELVELKAKALEMPYKDSNISMLIILPNDIEGLENLEKELKDFDLNQITSKLSNEKVRVFLPKFCIEYDLDLKQPLKELGLKGMFEQTTDFSGLFDCTEPQKISDVKHKAFLDINEAGSEAAAASFETFQPLSSKSEEKEFRADHPFIFAIRSDSAVYFAGHVAKF